MGLLGKGDGAFSISLSLSLSLENKQTTTTTTTTTTHTHTLIHTHKHTHTHPWVMGVGCLTLISYRRSPNSSPSASSQQQEVFWRIIVAIVLFRRPEPLLNGCENKTIFYHVMTLHNAAAHMYTGLIQSRSAITLLAQWDNDTLPFNCFIQIHTKGFSRQVANYQRRDSTMR